MGDFEIIATLVTAAVIAVLGVPVLALVLAVRARSEVRWRVGKLEARLDELTRKLNSASTPVAAPALEVKATPAVMETVAAVVACESVTPPSPSIPPHASDVPPSPVLIELPPVATAAEPSSSLEETIGVVWFTRIGAVIGLFVVAWFFKYAVDNDWIGPWARVCSGAGVGAMLLFGGEMMSHRPKRTHPYFVQGLMGLGLAVLVITAYASFGFYHLVPVPLAFAVVILLCLLGGTLAWRHDSQVLLVLSLVAALLNPVMLSTGVDRPFALFAYLLAMTSGAVFIAVMRGYRVALGLAIVGVVALFIGWYGKYFDLSAPPPVGEIDDLPENLQGKYYPIVTRWSPLLFVALYAAEWSIAGWLARRRGKPIVALVLYLVAAVTAHAAYTALLYDRIMILGGAMCVLAAAFSFLLVREKRVEWLGLPMVASFVVLASVSGDVVDNRLLPMMILTGGVSAIYFGVLLRAAVRADRLASVNALLLLCGSGVGLLALSALYLMPWHYHVFSALVAVLSLVYLLIAVAAKRTGLVVAVLLSGLLALSGAATQCETLEPWFVLICVVWFALHVGALAYDMFVKKNPCTPSRLAALVGAGVGFIALLLATTPGDAELLRSAITLSVGVVYLWFGVRLLRQGRAAQDQALLPLGMAVTLFTLAVAFLLEGASITLAWIVEGATLAWLSTRAKRNDALGHPAWLLGSAAVLFAAICRLLATDWGWASAQHLLFVRTLGVEGVLHPTPFLNPRAVVLLALGAALLASARFWVKLSAQNIFRVGALLALIVGHATLLVMLTGELRMATTSWPSVSFVGLPSDEFQVVLASWRSAVSAQSTRGEMVATMVMGGYAAVLLGLGFVAKERAHRLLGIGLFSLTLLKLVLRDVWALETIYRMAVGAVLAALLLIGGFLYARFAKRIRSLIMDNNSKTGLLIVFGLALWATHTHAAEKTQTAPDHYAHMAALVIPAAGDYRVEILPALYAASLTKPPFNDMRVLASDGTQAPFFVRAIPPHAKADTIDAAVFDPVTLADGSSQSVIEIRGTPREHNRVTLGIGGSDYLRSTRVESSLDGKRFGLLAEGSYVFEVSTGGPRSSRTHINYPTSRARYLRVTLLAGHDNQRLTINRAAVGLVAVDEVRPETGSIDLAVAGAGTIRAKDKASLQELSALPKSLPVDALELSIAAGDFVRRVDIEGSTRKQAWFPVGGGVIYRVTRYDKGASASEEQLLLPMTTDDRPYLRLVVSNNDDPPLVISGVRAYYQKSEMVVRARAAGEYRVYVGAADATGAQYDLAEQLARGTAPSLATLALGPVVANPAAGTGQEGKSSAGTNEKYTWAMQIGLGALAVVLVIWTVRLLRRKSA